MKKWTALAAVALVASPILADVAGDARYMIDSGKVSEAREMLEEEIESNPDAPNGGVLNQLLGEAVYLSGDLEDARKYFDVAKSRGVADASLWLGKLALVDYDFTEAARLYDNYVKLKTNARKEIPADVLVSRDGIKRAQAALGRVERIAIIDSLTVPKEEFFSFYKLPAQSGHILSPDVFDVSEVDGNVVFTNEKRDYAMWARTDSVGTLRLVQAEKLGGGEWSEPTETAEVLNAGGDADFPFMMPDGLTLYFANTGDDSLGGYDICVATRSSADDDFLEPQNLGMPYNSPFDDYMLAIDELNGVGWWATDRKQIPDSLTLYVFIPNDSRVNYTPGDDDVAAMARISDIRATQDSLTDYREILRRLEAIGTASGSGTPDFIFPIGKGRTLRYFDELPDEKTRNLMSRYQEALSLFAKSESSLRQLRTDYHVNGPTAPLKMQIGDLEKSIAAQRRELKTLRNSLYRILR